jgi:hypothetical protein
VQAAPISATHVGGYGAGGDFAPITRPSDTDRPRSGAWSNQSVAGELVNVELQAAFQPYPIAWSRHHALAISTASDSCTTHERLLLVALTMGRCVNFLPLRQFPFHIEIAWQSCPLPIAGKYI